MKLAALIVACLSFCSAPAAADPTAVPLVVGSVRDQSGAAVVDARISAQDAAGHTVASERTDEEGTFALRASGIAGLHISCAFCEPQTITTPHPPVVAIVRRYLALQQQTPSAEDIAALPYAHVEAAVALRPFTVLQDSKAPLPGPQLSDRGLQNGNGLLLDEGVPNYDIVSGYSLLSVLPARFTQTVQALPASEAFRYGDQAGGGTFEFTAANSQMGENSLTAGDDLAARASLSQANVQAIVAGSKDPSQGRERAEIVADTMLADAQLHFASAASLSNARGPLGDNLVNGYNFVALSLQRTRESRLSGSLLLDRGFYRSDFGGYRIDGTWADAQAAANAEFPGPVMRFAGVAMRESSGYDDPYDTGVVRIAAHLSQRNAYVGIRAANRFLDGTAALNAFDAAYSGGPADFPSAQAALLPSVRLDVKPNDRWTVRFSAADRFRLPTFLERVDPHIAPAFYNRSRLLESSASYTDLSRFRAEITNFSERTRGFSASTSWGTGVAVTWQLAPALSLRAWMLHFNRTGEYGQPISPRGSADVSSAWLTYETRSRVRADLLYRRNLMDFEPDAHFDAAVSGPLQHGLRWRLSSERRHRSRYVDFSLTSIR